MARGNIVTINQREFEAALGDLKDKAKALDSRWIKKTIRRNTRSIVENMKQQSHSKNLEQMIGATTAKKWAGPFGVRIGVIKNNPSLFPKFSAQALASVIEYGTQERIRSRAKYFGVIIGVASAGSMPATPFLRPSWEAGRELMVSKTIQSVEKKVMK